MNLREFLGHTHFTSAGICMWFTPELGQPVNLDEEICEARGDINVAVHRMQKAEEDIQEYHLQEQKLEEAKQRFRKLMVRRAHIEFEEAVKKYKDEFKSRARKRKTKSQRLTESLEEEARQGSSSFDQNATPSAQNEEEQKAPEEV